MYTVINGQLLIENKTNSVNNYHIIYSEITGQLIIEPKIVTMK